MLVTILLRLSMYRSESVDATITMDPQEMNDPEQMEMNPAYWPEEHSTSNVPSELAHVQRR